MVDVAKLQTMDRFIGINNVDDAIRLSPLVVNGAYVYPLQQASNVEIDNTYGLKSRGGYAETITGTDLHSIWSDDDTCLVVDGTTLYQYNEDDSITSLRTGLTKGARMSCAPWNDRVYYTNGFEIGYVKNLVSYLIPDPQLTFKQPLPAGQLIEYYRGCLYVARDNILYISDPLCDYYDTRHGYRIFANRITLLRAVDSGLYVGDERVWWVKGEGPEDFARDEVYPYKPIPYTDVRVNGQNVGGGMDGNVALWTGENGICVGNNSGNVTNLTEARYSFTAHGQGTGFIRETGNIRHYINSLF